VSIPVLLVWFDRKREGETIVADGKTGSKMNSRRKRQREAEYSHRVSLPETGRVDADTMTEEPKERGYGCVPAW